MAAVGYIFLPFVIAVISSANVDFLAIVVYNRRLVLAVKTRKLADDDKPLK